MFFLVFIFYNLCYTFANTSNIECDIEGLCKVLVNSMRFCENGGGQYVKANFSKKTCPKFFVRQCLC